MTSQQKILATLTILGVVALRPVRALADAYAWTDESGVKHVTDSIAGVPEKFRASAIHMGDGSSAHAPSEPAEAPAPAPEAKPASGPGGAGSDEIFRFGAAPVAKPAAPAETAPVPKADDLESKKDDQGHDKIWWQQQTAAALNRQSKAADQVHTLEANKIVATAGYISDRAKYHHELDSARAELEAANKAVDDLHKQAKKDGADPKWLVLPGMEEASGTKKP